MSGRVAPHQVGGHVVGRTEAAGEGVAAGAGQPGHLFEGHEGRPQHHRVADLVDAPPARPAGQLGVLTRREELVAFAGELGQLLDHHRAGRHVDAERQRLGGEHRLDQAGGEAGFHRLLEGGHQPGVVGGVAGLQSGQPAGVVEHGQVVVGQGVHVLLGDGPDLAALLHGGQPLALANALGHGVVAGRPAEDEVDGREHVVLLEQLEHLDPPGCEQPAPRPAPHTRMPQRLGVEGHRLRIGPAVDQRRQEQQPLGSLVAEQVQIVQAPPAGGPR